MANKTKKTPLGRAGRFERESRTNKIISNSMIAIVSIVLIVIIGGAVSEFLVKPKQAVATFGDVEISTKDFQTRVKIIRQIYVDKYIQSFNFLSYLSGLETEGLEDMLNGYYQEMMSIQEYLDNTDYLGGTVLVDLTDEYIMKTEAEKFEISISNEELEVGIQTFLGYDASAEELVDTSTTSEDTESDATNNSDETTNEEPVVTPEPTVDAYQQYLTDYSDQVSRYKDELNISEDEFKSFIEVQLIKEKLFEEISKSVIPFGTSIAANNIILSDLDFANEVVAKYEELEDWILLKKFYSHPDYTSIISMEDFFSYTEYDQPALFEASQNSEVGDLIGPIETPSGFYILLIRNIDDRALLSSEELDANRSEYFEEWFTEIREDYEFLYLDNLSTRIPTDPEIPFQYRLQVPEEATEE